MLYWVIKQIIISLTLILLIHYLYFFFKKNLTEPKVKDLVNKPIKRYMEMYKTMDKPDNLPPKVDTGKMKDELKNYLKTLTTKDDIPGVDINNTNSFNTNYQTL